MYCCFHCCHYCLPHPLCQRRPRGPCWPQSYPDSHPDCFPIPRKQSKEYRRWHRQTNKQTDRMTDIATYRLDRPRGRPSENNNNTLLNPTFVCSVFMAVENGDIGMLKSLGIKVAADYFHRLLLNRGEMFSSKLS